MELISFVFICLLATLTKAQVQDGTPCETPDQKYGLCIPVKSCQFVIDILKRYTPSVDSYLRSLSCGFDRDIPLVCCPQVSTRSNPNPQPVESTSTDEAKPRSLLLPPDCGFSKSYNPRVVGGIDAKLGEFPWMAALGYKNSNNPTQPKWLCGGSLISDKHVLTAGHCVNGRKDLYIVRLGELVLYDDNDGANPEDIPIEKVQLHEDYNPTSFTNDIAIITLVRASTNPQVWPICLPWQSDLKTKDYVGFRSFVTGWGSLYFNGPSSAKLQLVSLPIVDNSICKTAFGAKTNITVIDERIICAGYLTGGKDSCKGDSGGPLQFVASEKRNVRYYQLGIVSYGFRCAEAGFPGVYTRVTHFLDWIQKNV